MACSVGSGRYDPSYVYVARKWYADWRLGDWVMFVGVSAWAFALAVVSFAMALKVVGVL